MSAWQYMDSVPLERADRAEILSWWEPRHDELMMDLMRRFDWHYYLEAPKVVEAQTTSRGFEQWRLNDRSLTRFPGQFGLGVQATCEVTRRW